MAGKRRRVRRAPVPINNISLEDLAAAAIGQILRGEYFHKLGGVVVSHEILEPLVRASQINLTIHNNYYGAYEMSTYTNSGQVGAMGDQARSDDNKFIQAAPADPIDLKELARELALVRTEMRKRAREDEPDHDEAIGKIAVAEKAAKAGDQSTALNVLKGAGSWALDIAKSVATGVAKDAIEGKLGM